MNTKSPDSPSAKAAPQIQRYFVKLDPRSGMEAVRKDDSGEWIRYADHQQALSDSLQPYRDLAAKMRADAETFDTSQKRIDYTECASMLEHLNEALIKEAGK